MDIPFFLELVGGGQLYSPLQRSRENPKMNFYPDMIGL